METISIFVVDDESSILSMLALYLAGRGYEVKTSEDGQSALRVLEREDFDVVITDLKIGDTDGLEILKRVKSNSPRTEVIIITGHGSVDSAVEAMKLGAFDYITKPIDFDELNLEVQKAHERQCLVAEVKKLRCQIKDLYGFDAIVATSPAMQKVLRMVKRIARSDATVVIQGESGTGKEVVARAIHHHGLRGEGPFVAINCGALPETLLESELFGHVKGAFTGATITKKGLFEEASTGTIFLDEVGETSPAFQVKLLRVLQENEIRRVGDTRDIRVDVRVLASSNTPLKQLVAKGLFREDLYYRLSVIPLFIPPLRERREDIVPLATFFIRRYCRRTGRKIVKISEDVIQQIESYAWPGNVRELENAIERAMILVEGQVLRTTDVIPQTSHKNQGGYGFSNMSMKDVEKTHIQKVLQQCAWNRKEASRVLSIGYNTLWRKIKEYHLEQ